VLEVTRLLGVAREPGRLAAQVAAVPDRFGDGRGRVAVVVWNLVAHCNMTCPHCYAAAAVRRSPLDLDTAEAFEVLGQLASAGVRVIIFSGGEPLLRDDLYELAGRAVQLGMAPQLSSNGVLIDHAVATRLRAAGFGYVGISIDGRAGFNDGYRGMAGGFDRACAGLAAARAAGLRTGLRITLTRDNVDELDPMLDVAGELGVDRFYVSHLQYAGRGRRLAHLDLSPEECRSTLERLFERADRMIDADPGAGPAVVTGGNDSAGPLLADWVADRHGPGAAAAVRELLRRRGGNSAGEKLLCIDHRGRVHPDQFWRGQSLGDLRHQRFAEVLAHPLRAQLRRRGELLGGRCGECRYQPMCRGSHRERALAAAGDPWAPDPACVMTDAEIAGARPALREVMA